MKKRTKIKKMITKKMNGNKRRRKKMMTKNRDED